MAINQKSRNRLIVVTIVLFGLVAFLVYQSSMGSYSYFKTVTELHNDDSLVGLTVRVGGQVVKNSWTKDSKGHHFKIADQAAELKINYDGVMPQTFGEDTQVVAEGIYKPDFELDAKKIITKCPTKYESKNEAAKQ